MAAENLLLGYRVKQLRKQKGLTQDQVAEAAGIDSKSLSRIECNRFNPAIETLKNLAIALNVEMQDFFVSKSNLIRLERGYLLEMVATASDSEIFLIAKAARTIINKKTGRVRIKR